MYKSDKQFRINWDIIDGIFENMYAEYTQRIDQFSKEVLLSNLDLLLTYAQRFYARQFITRNQIDSSLLHQFQQELSTYLQSDQLMKKGIPRVDYFAAKLHLSPNYLSDLLKSLTGKTTKEHIHYQLIENAKYRLRATESTIAEIAYSLGFEYPQYFNRLFKSKTGLTPKTFRSQSTELINKLPE